jgi:tetraacyldisaccharide 4'-kinase
MKINTVLERAWSRKSAWLVFLLPLTYLFMLITTVRRKLYDWGIFSRQSFSTPVIVVGNILVGGTGKTPFVIALVEYLQSKHLTVGVVSRGYKAVCQSFPHEVSLDETAIYSGDEPSLIKEKTQCFVVIDPNRPRGIQWMIDKRQPDVIICDDGLQHYALKPGLTLVLHPHERVYSPFCLPTGPLRESLSRLNAFDLVVDRLDLDIDKLDLDPSWKYTLVTGIANPDRVSHYLRQLGIDAELKLFPDHHDFTEADFKNITGPIIMTEKDEIKCKELMLSQPVYVVRVKSILPDTVKHAVNLYLGIQS